jgi:hypothetical protein
MGDQQRDHELDDQGASRDGSRQDDLDHAPTASGGSSFDDGPPVGADDPLDGAPDDLYAKLNPRQQKAILALVTEPTIAKAAEQAGVSESTVHRWLLDDTFVRAHRRARRETFSQAIALAQRYTPLAVNNLAKIMSDPATAASARVSASCAILKFGRDSIELDDLAARLDNLERATQQSAAGRSWR